MTTEVTAWNGVNLDQLKALRKPGDRVRFFLYSKPCKHVEVTNRDGQQVTLFPGQSLTRNGNGSFSVKPA